MTGGLVAAVILAVIALVILAKSLVVVPAGQAYVVERLGKYHATFGPGFHLLLPLVDVIRFRHALDAQAVELPGHRAITRDNRVVTVKGAVHLKVVDARRASYAVADPTAAAARLAGTVVTREVAALDLDAARERLGAMGDAVAGALGEPAAGWGIEIVGCDIREIVPGGVAQ